MPAGEELDEALESALLDMASSADGLGWVTGVDARSPEYRELKRLGYIGDSREYLDGTASARLSHKAMSYAPMPRSGGSDDHGGPLDAAKGVASVAGSFVGGMLKELSN